MAKTLSLTGAGPVWLSDLAGVELDTPTLGTAPVPVPIRSCLHKPVASSSGAPAALRTLVRPVGLILYKIDMSRLPYRTSVAVALLLALSPQTSAVAQFKNGNQTVDLNLPRVSQHAIITQRIGVTDITIDYHRPRA